MATQSKTGRDSDLPAGSASPKVSKPERPSGEPKEPSGEPAPPAPLSPAESTADAALIQDERVLAILAAKVLLAWLRHREDRDSSFTLDLKRLSDAQARLLADAMVAAACADGTFGPQEQERIGASWKLINAHEQRSGVLADAVAKPRLLDDVLENVRDVHTGAIVYAGSLLAIDRRSPVHRYYLMYLAARLKLADTLTKRLQRQFGR